MRVAVVGTGYVGSVTGACLASTGHEVVCVDNQSEKVDLINSGRAPIEEPGLNDLIGEAVMAGNLRATTELGKAAAQSEVIFLSLPTPSLPDGSANTEFIYSAARELIKDIQDETIIANRSTVPPGTTQGLGRYLSNLTKVRFYPVSNPEFLAEGTAVHDTQHPSRIVIGTEEPDTAGERMRELYHPFVLDDPGKVLIMDPTSAEMSKMAANTYLATDITVANLIAQVCEQTGADYRKVQQALRFDPRIGSFTHPGPGYGGSCFPKDTRSMAQIADQEGIKTNLFKAVSEANEDMKSRLFERIKANFLYDLSDKRIGVFGLSFKPNTDDIREAPSLTLIQQLLDSGAEVVAYDPKSGEAVQQHFKNHPNLTIAPDKYAAAQDTDAVAIVTEWDEFKSLDFDRLKDTMRRPLVFDWRSIYEPEVPERHGIKYVSVGRG